MQLTILEQSLSTENLEQLPGHVALLAPTGKAAQRLRQTGRPAMTLQVAAPHLAADDVHLVIDEATTLTPEDAKALVGLPSVQQLTLIGQPAPEVMDLLQGHATETLKRGDSVRLVSKPDGRASKDYPLTVGQVYEVKGFMGSNVETTCDEPGRTVSYWRGRVEKA